MKATYQHNFKKAQCRIGNNLDYKLHFHHQVELVYMFKGEGTAVIDGKELTLKSGDILTVFPNQLHEYKYCSDEQFFITIFKPEILYDFKDIFYNMLPESNVYSTDNKNTFLYDLAYRLPEISKAENIYYNQIYKGLLYAFFGELFSKINLVKAKSADLSVLKSVLNYCVENYKNDISLNSVSTNLHVSKYYISHLLNDKLGISFNEYINSLRIADAVILLEQGKPDITEIAQISGFNTVRTFNRAFKSIYGQSPTQYKKNDKTTE